LEFDKESGALKKTKFVSEADVIQQQLASFGLSKPGESTTNTFTLSSGVPHENGPTVKKLERLRLPRHTENLLLAQAKTKEQTEKHLKEYCKSLINTRRD